MTDQYNTSLPIKMWAEADRPREKLVLKGKAQLSDAEILAIILGSGSRDETALDLSKRILASVDNNLNALGKLDLTSLKKFKGIGQVKAITLSAALELGRRRQGIQISEKPKIICSRDVYNIMHGQLTDLTHEEFWILLVNRANMVEHKIMISKGGVAGTVVDNKIIFKHALNNLSSSIVLVHNHPSTNLKPSKADLDITKKIATSAKLLDINVLDHIIIGGDSYFSFADEDLL
jgi:DNA repair protein RadC